MLDSGIFSAWNKGGTLDLKEYIAYLKRNEKWLYSYVNMDSIPGKFGVIRTTADVEKSAQISYDNLQEMKNAGLHPIPVFHQGEDLKWLFRMIEDGDRYIGISTAKDLRTQVQRRWLDQVFTLITDKQGRPVIRTHGFGITNPVLMTRYPFFTCDSTTWSLHAGMGHLLFPPYEGVRKDATGFHGGTPNYLKKPISLVTSGVQHESSSGQDRQFEKFVHERRELVEYAVQQFLSKHLGCTIAHVRNNANGRRHSILVYYLELCKHLQDIRFTELSASLLTYGEQALQMPKAVKPFNMTLMFATMFNKSWEQLMADLGVTTRLLSYYKLRTMKDSVLEHYVTTGLSTPGEYVQRAPKTSWASESYKSYRSGKLHERLERLKNEASGVT